MNLPRLFTICAIFVAILTLPLYFLKGKAQKSRAATPAAAPSSAPVKS